ncbi:hypothetical protein D3C71_2004200 [compost metagenome]
MRTDLALQHPVFQLLLLLLIRHAGIHQGQDIMGQSVDASSHIAQLAVPFDIPVDEEIALGDLIDPLSQFLYWQADRPGEVKGNKAA